MTAKRWMWLSFFVLAMLLGGDANIQPLGSSPPLGWWLVAIGFGWLWGQAVSKPAGSVAQVGQVAEHARCEVYPTRARILRGRL
jgi:hypothetical protein